MTKDALKVFGASAIITAWAIGASFLLAGCSTLTPYVAARHIDATPLQGGDDAWDVGCFGVKTRGKLQLKTGYCQNIRGGNLFEASLEYDLFREKK